MSKQNNNIPENEDYGNDYITLVDGNGKETEFEIVDSLVTENNEYFALIPVETAENVDSDDGELVILKVVEENGEEFLETVVDDDILEAVFELFREKEKDNFDFI